jgi:hypothetical protein
MHEFRKIPLREGETLQEWEAFHFSGEINPYALPQPNGRLRDAYSDAYDLVREVHDLQIRRGGLGPNEDGSLIILGQLLPRGFVKYDVMSYFEMGYGKFSAFSSGHLTRAEYEGEATERCRLQYTRLATMDDVRALEMMLQLEKRTLASFATR